MDIVITDDTINEVEQVFVILLQVASAVDVNRVDLQSGRSTSLGRIFDNDRKWINILLNTLHLKKETREYLGGSA